MDEWNKTGSACDRMCNYYDDLHERLDSYNESYYQEKISEWEDTFSQMNANVTDIQGELDGCYAKNNEYEKVKNEWYSNPAIVFGLGAVGCFLFLNKNKIFDRVSNTTGTEGGFEPTEGV